MLAIRFSIQRKHSAAAEDLMMQLRADVHNCTGSTFSIA